MRAGARVAAFAAAVGVAFGAAALAGAALDPLRDGGGDGHGHATDTADAHGGGHPTEAVAAALPGLAVSEGGHTLAPEASTLPLGRPAELRFRILGPDGRTVTDMDLEHARRMHLIVVRRDLTGYQHLHPALDASGAWSVRLRLPTAGVYRAYADFRTGGRAMTLATDLFVAGAFTPVPLPPRGRVHRRRLPRRPLGAAGRRRASAAAVRLSRDGDRSPTWSPTSAPTATSSRCATATSPSCTSTPRSRRAGRDPLQRRAAVGRAATGCSCSSSTARVRTVALTVEVPR